MIIQLTVAKEEGREETFLLVFQLMSKHPQVGYQEDGMSFICSGGG